MSRNNKKNAAGAVLLYLLLASGSWMFVNSYANSFNRLNEEKIVPASMTVNGGVASVSVLGKSRDICLTPSDTDSRYLLAVYLASSDEIRSACYLLAVAYGE